MSNNPEDMVYPDPHEEMAQALRRWWTVGSPGDDALISALALASLAETMKKIEGHLRHIARIGA